MGRLNSLADVLTDWDELLEAVRRSPDLLPDVEEEIALLADLLAQARGLKARQNELAALRQEATQRLNAEMAQGKETTIRMRSMIRGKIGPRNERLVQFGIAPLRKRRPPVSRPPQEDGGLPLRDDPQETPDAGVEARAAADPAVMEGLVELRGLAGAEDRPIALSHGTAASARSAAHLLSEEAGGNGARLVVFPEVWLAGYSYRTEGWDSPLPRDVRPGRPTRAAPVGPHRSPAYGLRRPAPGQ